MKFCEFFRKSPKNSRIFKICVNFFKIYKNFIKNSRISRKNSRFFLKHYKKFIIISKIFQKQPQKQNPKESVKMQDLNQKPKVLCVVPARGGSKRIPRKNIVDFAGKPLIAHSIENALNSGIFDEVIVSTDDDEIAKIARDFGAKTPFIRPKDLSDDYAATSAVIAHAIRELDKAGQGFDSVCCLYATAPLINSQILLDAYNDFANTECEFLFAACAFKAQIQRAFAVDSLGRVKMFDESKFNARSQDLPPAFHDAGAFYFGKSESWLHKKMLFKPYSKAFLLPPNLVCDIDSPQDLEFARILYEVNKALG